MAADNITFGAICDAIATTLFTATDEDGDAVFNRLESYDELTEGINAGDTPLLQVYWESYSVDPSGETDRTAYQGGVRQKVIVFHADAYTSQRSHLNQDMQAAVDAADAMLDVIEVQNVKPYFGLHAIKAFNVQASRTLFEYTDGVMFMGTRMIITVWVY